MLQLHLQEADITAYLGGREVVPCLYANDYPEWRHRVRTWLTWYFRAAHEGLTMEEAMTQLLHSSSPDFIQEAMRVLGYDPTDRVVRRIEDLYVL